ncbi:MAG TPA: glycosyltransferase family 1 protein, partial [Candidatus Dormibacteraeota bacterium]|nr:glycosyltransferase family 1 protein [Candidatus Dormibacteraeota bacterium]
MKIAIDTLFEHPERPTSAIDYLVNLVASLPAEGPQHDFYALTSPRNRRYFVDGHHRNLHLVNCGISNEHRGLRILAQQGIIPAQMRRYGIDALFAAGNVCPAVGGFCRVLKINTLHHILTPNLIGWARSRYRRYAFAASARRADHIVANSAATKADICRFMSISEEKVSVVWEAVDEVFRPVSKQQRDRFLADFGLRPDYILFVSSLWPYKNPETLLRAFAILSKERHFDLDLVFVGRDDNSYQQKLEELAGDLGIRQRTRFLGAIPNRQMPAVYSAARVFVYPSLAETFGKPLVEAMRCGVPVVASNVTSIPEVLGDAGLLVDPRDVDRLAAAIRRAATDEALRRDMIARGLSRGDLFSWTEVARRTLQITEAAHCQWKQREGR